MRGCLSCSGLLRFRCRAGIPREPEISGREKVEGRKLGFIFENPSPRVRGKRHQHTPTPHGHRLIPACAGKTLFDVSTGKQRRAHPRVCGENPVERRPRHDPRGSSPRVRGKRDRPGSRPGLRGLIPACAGKTVIARSKSSGRGAHPRVCGENSRERDAVVFAKGSSPRVRGKREEEANSVNISGLIPACAGKTRLLTIRNGLDGAHPRVCGENNPETAQIQAGLGSSPRVRGKLDGGFPDVGFGGLIPACAGKT